MEAKVAALALAALARREIGATVHDRDESERPVFDDNTFAKFIHATERLAEEALRRELAAFFGIPQPIARAILKEHGNQSLHKGHFAVRKGKAPTQEELTYDEKGNFRPPRPRK